MNKQYQHKKTFLVTKKLLKSSFNSRSNSATVFRNCILHTYNTAVALNAVMIELFIHSLFYRHLFRSSAFRNPLPLIFRLKYFISSRPFDVLSLFAIFHTFPRCVFHVKPTARPSAIFATQQTRRYRDEADEMTCARKFLAYLAWKSIDPFNLDKRTIAKNFYSLNKYFR